MKFEAVRLIHFSGDVFAALAVVVAKHPNLKQLLWPISG